MLRSFSKLIEYAAKPPSTHVPAWTRLSQKIKAPSGQQQQLQQQQSPDGKHIENLQRSGRFDIEDSLGKLEEELMEEIAGALGKTGDKCVWHFKEMNKAKLAWEKAVCSPAQVQHHSVSLPTFAFPVFMPSRTPSLAPSPSPSLSTLERQKIAQQFNQARQLFEDARRELIIHRQACGFTANNYQIVEEIFPLPAPLLVMTEKRIGDLRHALKHCGNHSDPRAAAGENSDGSRAHSGPSELEDESSLRSALRGLGLNHIRCASSGSREEAGSSAPTTGAASVQGQGQGQEQGQGQGQHSIVSLEGLSRPQLIDLLRHCIQE